MVAQALDQWREAALCKGRAAEFDPPRGFPDDRGAWPALDLCAICPSRAPCRTWVMDLPQRQDPGGVCGGYTELRRTQLRRETGRLRECTACGQWRDRDRFSPRERGRDGLASVCKDCAAARKRQHREEAGCGP